VDHTKRKDMADQLPITIQVRKENKQLVIVNEMSKSKLDLFVKSLDEGQVVSVNYEVITADKTYAQLSKLMKCIREVATYTGDTFESVKYEVKVRSGLCINGQCKSFADCSKDEMSLAIQSIIEIGDIVGFNLH
jgi:hypothetical protein